MRTLYADPTKLHHYIDFMNKTPIDTACAKQGLSCQSVEAKPAIVCRADLPPGVSVTAADFIQIPGLPPMPPGLALGVLLKENQALTSDRYSSGLREENANTLRRFQKQQDDKFWSLRFDEVAEAASAQRIQISNLNKIIARLRRPKVKKVVAT